MPAPNCDSARRQISWHGGFASFHVQRRGERVQRPVALCPAHSAHAPSQGTCWCSFQTISKQTRKVWEILIRYYLWLTPSPFFSYWKVSDYSNETPSSRDSSTERDRRLSVINPPRKRARSRSNSPPVLHGLTGVGTTVTATTTTAVVDDANRIASLKVVHLPTSSSYDHHHHPHHHHHQKENGLPNDAAEEEEEEDDSPSDEQKQQQQMLLDVHRESLLSQALEGRSSQSLMAHLLATRRSNQSETSSNGNGGDIGGGGGLHLSSAHHVDDEDDASDSDDTDASDRYTKINSLSLINC